MMAQPPARNVLEVLDWIMSRPVHEYLDASGRPIGEGRSAAFQQIETEMQSCPYAGSRYHHPNPMNLTALRQMPPWQDVLTMLSWLSARYRSRHQTEITSYDDLAAVTGAGIFLADFLALRSHRPLPSGEVPVLISGLYKVCLGFQLAYLPERFAAAAAHPASLPGPTGFYRYLEENELLIGEAEVCSGSPAMIMQAYDAIISPKSFSQETLPSPCARLEIAWEQFDDFTEHAAAIWRDLVLYVMEAQQFCPKLTDAPVPADVRDRINACLEQRATQLLAGQTGLVVELARAVLQGADNPADASVPVPAVPQPEAPSLRPDSLAATVVTWLADVAHAEMGRYGSEVASALSAELVRYDEYEAKILAELNRRLTGLMRALGLARPSGALTAPALSQVCGRTLRDWATG